MYRNILVPFDGSEPSQRALKAALEMSSSSVPVVITVLKVAAPMNFDDSTFEVAARMAGVPKIDAEVLDATRDNYNNEHRKGVQTQIQGFFASVPDRSSSRTGVPRMSSAIMQTNMASIASQWAGAVSASSARRSAP